LLLAALALTHGALILTTGSVLAIAVVITLAGATIAPSVSSSYAMVDAAAPAGTRTEAYSWQLTATLVGGSLGNSAAGALAQSSGAAAAFTLVAAAGGLAVLTALVRSRSLANAKQNNSRAASPAPGDPAENPSQPSTETKTDPRPRRRKRRLVRRDRRTVASDRSACLASAHENWP
jgi:MFS family permease